jgi:hypothetical protein
MSSFRYLIDITFNHTMSVTDVSKPPQCKNSPDIF